MSGGKACGKQAAEYTGQQPAAQQAGEKEETEEGIQVEEGQQPAAQKKRTRNTKQATQTQPALLMLRRTSKRVKEVVDKMRLPAVVRLSFELRGVVKPLALFWSSSIKAP
jgi:hypothetical protein